MNPSPTQYPPAPAPPPIKPFIDDNAGMRLLLPIKVTTLAFAAGYLGLFAVLLFPAPIALIVGIAAILELKRKPEMHGMGRAVFGTFMGAVGTTGLIYTLLR